MIDDSLGEKFRTWQKEKEQLEGKYLSLRAQAREIERDLDNASEIQGDLDDINKKLELFVPQR